MLSMHRSRAGIPYFRLGPLRIREMIGVSAFIAVLGCGDVVGTPIQSDDLSLIAVPDTPYCSEVSDWPEEYANNEEDMYFLVEGQRKERGFFFDECGGYNPWRLRPIIPSAELKCSARLHSRDMEERSFFDIVNPDGVFPKTRMEAAGFETREDVDELIVQGTDPAKVLEQIIKDPQWACVRLVSTERRMLGIGYYQGFWTFDIAED